MSERAKDKPKGEPPEGISSLEKTLWDENGLHQVSDWAAQESPIAFEYNCVSYAVMMATPADLQDFALGFSLSERIVSSVDDVLDIELAELNEPHQAGKVISMIIGADQLNALKQRRRALVGNTGCGICGAETIEQALSNTLEFDPIEFSGPAINHAAIQAALANLEAHQELNRAAGAIHAAAWCSVDGSIVLLREDVGRHNALDKLIGAVARQRAQGSEECSKGFILISSRASYEMVSKACALGAGVLVAVSGVTQLAVETANRAGVTLLGFSRPGRHSIYTHPNRVE